MSICQYHLIPHSSTYILYILATVTHKDTQYIIINDNAIIYEILGPLLHPWRSGSSSVTAIAFPSLSLFEIWGSSWSACNDGWWRCIQQIGPKASSGSNKRGVFIYLKVIEKLNECAFYMMICMWNDVAYVHIINAPFSDAYCHNLVMNLFKYVLTRIYTSIYMHVYVYILQKTEIIL